MSSAWDLIKTKQYAAAVTEYTRLYQQEGGTYNLHNRGLAYLLLGDYTAALHDFRLTARGDPRGTSTDAYIYAGVTLWYLNRPEQAATTWREGLAAPYTYAAGGVEVPALLM